MALRLGDEAPNFQAETTEGNIDFHEWIGDSWAIFFSHPKDFTPVCTTEFGAVAQLAPEFEKRNTKVLGVSVDSVEDHGDSSVRAGEGDYPEGVVGGAAGLYSEIGYASASSSAGSWSSQASSGWR